MALISRLPNKTFRFYSFVVLIAIAGFLVIHSYSRQSEPPSAGGDAKLVSVQPLPEMDAAMCEWVPASARTSLLIWQRDAGPRAAASDVSRVAAAKRPPIRTVGDSYSVFSAVAVDPVRNEVVMTDENLFSILVYDRLENTPPGASLSEPKRMIRGLETMLEFQCSLYVDPANGDIYAVNNDTMNRLVVFSREARGNVPPNRFLETPHTTFGIAVDEKSQELMLTIQDDAAVVTYSKTAKGNDPPLRLIQGDQTQLADPHGIAIDPKKDFVYVSNWGTVNSRRVPAGQPRLAGESGDRLAHENEPLGRIHAVPGSGKFLPPSITVYSRASSGNTPPIQVIQGSQTQLNWPTALAIDPERGELFVANDTGDSIVVFNAAAEGDAAPIRVLKGSKTLIKNPTGVYFDQKNNELWVTNFGNHTAAVFKPTASGDTPPLRVIRSAPLSTPAPMLGNPHVVAFDSKREEILVAT